jgi:hypothetical protein
MFDERRSRITAGIDKSYLLEPIAVDTKITSTNKQRQQQVNGPVKSSREQKALNYTKVIVPPLQNRTINHDINGNNHHLTSNNDSNNLVKNTSMKFGATKVNGNLGTIGASTKKIATSVAVPLKNVTNQKVSVLIDYRY